MIVSVFSCGFPSLSSETETFSMESVQNSSHLAECRMVNRAKTPDAGTRGRACSSGAMLPALKAVIWSGRTNASSLSIFFSSFSQHSSLSEKGVLATAPYARTACSDNDAGFHQPDDGQDNSSDGTAAAEADAPRAVFVKVFHEPRQLSGGYHSAGGSLAMA